MTSLEKLGVALAAGICLPAVAGAQPIRVPQDKPEAAVQADLADPQIESSVPQRVGSAPQRVASPPPAADFDARIRRVDREGPDGATQLWVYNAGPGTAAGCIIAARSEPEADFAQVAAVEDVGPRQTVKIPEPLPADAAEFRVECPGEPEVAQSNNVATYHLELAWPQKTE